MFASISGNHLKRIMLGLTVVLGCLCGNSLALTGDILITAIPRTAVEPGILISQQYKVHSTYQVKLEIFIDLNCPTSYEAYTHIIKPLAEYYSTDSRLVILAHLYPLPYHRNAMLSTQGAFTVMEYNPAMVLPYIEAVMAKWDQLSTSNTRNLSEYEVLQYITVLAVQSTGISGEDFRAHIDTYRSHVQKVWKYGAKRGVAATPTFFINGIQMNLPDDSTLPMDKYLWIGYIDDVLKEMNDIVNY